MKLKTILIILITSMKLSAQTELVPNGSFELGTRHNSDCQASNNELANGYNNVWGCDGWYQAIGNVDACTISHDLSECPTADWYDNSVCSTDPDMLDKWGFPPASGSSKCIGMILNDNYTEGIRTTLVQNLEGGKYYKLKMRIAVGQSTNANNSTTAKAVSVDVSFTKFSEYWNASTGSSSNVRLDNVLNFSIPANSPHQWYEITKYFRVPQHVDGGYGSDLSNMIIRRSAGNDDVRSYLYLDDVSLVEADYCSASCSPAELHEDIAVECCGEQQNEFPNIIQPHIPFNFTVSNATEVELLVYSSWGSLMKRIFHYDPNGLKWEFDPANVYNGNFPYFRFVWIGDDYTGALLPTGVYPIQVNIRNCDKYLGYASTVTIIDPCNCENYDFPEIHNTQPKDCCPQVLYVDNKYYNFIESEQANQYLYAGTTGPVVVTSTANVTYTAGTAIDLGPYFSTEPDAHFDAYIQSCNPGGAWITNSPARANKIAIRQPEMMGQDTFRVSDEMGARKLPAEAKQALLFPNPANSFVMVKPALNSSCSQTTIELIDIAGKVISSGLYKTDTAPIKINLNGVSSGLYQVAIRSCDKTSYEKLLIERP